MKLTDYSKHRVMAAAAQWHVDKEYFDPLYNYLVHGFEPGSFWTAVLANDFMSAIQHSHPANRVQNLKAATGWIQDQFPGISYGSYQLVNGWCHMTEAQRRSHLEACSLIYTERQEVELVLRGADSQEPYMA